MHAGDPDTQNRRKTGGSGESGRLDLNQRPFGPQPNALPDCATPRSQLTISRENPKACLGSLALPFADERRAETVE
jgi:hypothetical protein